MTESRMPLPRYVERTVERPQPSPETDHPEVHEDCEIANAVGRIYEVCDRCKAIMWPVVAGPGSNG